MFETTIESLVMHPQIWRNRQTTSDKTSHPCRAGIFWSSYRGPRRIGDSWNISSFSVLFGEFDQTLDTNPPKITDKLEGYWQHNLCMWIFHGRHVWVWEGSPDDIKLLNWPSVKCYVPFLDGVFSSKGPGIVITVRACQQDGYVLAKESIPFPPSTFSL